MVGSAVVGSAVVRRAQGRRAQAGRILAARSLAARSIAAALAAVFVAVFVAGCGNMTAGLAITATTSATSGSALDSITEATPVPFHPRGFVLAKGAAVKMPIVESYGMHATVAVRVGEVFTLSTNEWLPDNPANPAELIGGAVVLAAVSRTGVTYQAVRPGSVLFQVGPVGHGGCGRTHQKCADAMPPPVVVVEVTAR